VFICILLTAVSTLDPAVTGLDDGNIKLGLGKVPAEENLDRAVTLDTAEKGRAWVERGGFPQCTADLGLRALPKRRFGGMYMSNFLAVRRDLASRAPSLGDLER